jgi:hypothetical protein
MVDTLVPEWEKKDLFNRAILDATPGRTVLPILALALTAFLFAFGFQRLARASHRRDLGIKPLDQAVLGAISAEPLWKQRERSMLRVGNLWEPAQTETRRFFAEVLGGASPAVLPAVRVTGSWWRRWKLRRELRRLWRLAQGQANGRFSPAAFDRLRIRLRELRDASARGVLRFDPVDLARHSWPNLGGKGS